MRSVGLSLGCMTVALATPIGGCLDQSSTCTGALCAGATSSTTVTSSATGTGSSSSAVSSGPGSSVSGGGMDGAGSDDAAAEDATQPTSDATVGSQTNLITNGNFSQGSDMWSVVSGNGTVSVPSSGGGLCVSDASTAVLGWPEPAGTPGAVLTAGASYTFSYVASAPGSSTPVQVDAKVGHTSTPYTADFDTSPGTDAVSSSPQTFTHTFTASAGDSSAGVAFTFTTTDEVCFQSVSLVQN